MLKFSINLALLILVLQSKVFSNEFVERDLTFNSKDTSLSGSLVYVKNTELKAAVVFVHGSGEQTRNLNLARALASKGIATFVYDKRGVGKSGGLYERDQSVSGPNIELLAQDASSAVKLLASKDELKGAKFGLIGISQAGWIIPLAAQNVDSLGFIAVWSGPVCKVSEEDIYSTYTRDKDSAEVPSFEQALKARTFKYRWPTFLGRDTDSSEDLSFVTVPSLWVYGAQDGSIPVDLSIKNLERLKNSGHDIEFKVVSGVGHNNVPETLDLVANWINSKI